MYGADAMTAFAALKGAFDPKGLLGRGTTFVA
jgi:FAD/FMN-containing dehydrogenase